MSQCSTTSPVMRTVVPAIDAVIASVINDFAVDDRDVIGCNRQLPVDLKAADDGPRRCHRHVADCA